MFRPLAFLAYALALLSRVEPALSVREFVTRRCLILPGQLYCTDDYIEGSIAFNGIAKLFATDVEGNFSVNGVADLTYDSNIYGNLRVNGVLNMVGSSVHSDSVIEGKATLTTSYLKGVNELHGTFHGTYAHLGSSTFYSNSIAFYRSNIRDISVISEAKKAQVCVLDKTTVQSINFTHNNGLVFMDASSKVAEITGGKVENVTSCPF
ncbi:MAG: hypothetical protein K0R66_1144 [Gammaproteobacteria bacterium]|jgi:hypothetical protein|nr:hypothetical protein [Gammaproteobacteria bacterium]